MRDREGWAADGHRFLREGEVARALREQERRRRDEVARLKQAHGEEVERLRRRLEELERRQH